ARSTGSRRSTLGRLLVGIHLFTQLLRALRQRLGLGVHGVLAVGLEGLLGFLQRGFDPGLFVRADLVAVLAERLLHRMSERFELVLGRDQFQRLLVFLGVRLGVLHHALDL